MVGRLILPPPSPLLHWRLQVEVAGAYLHLELVQVGVLVMQVVQEVQ